MFSKNPFIMPVFAIAFLVLLYMFQQQQKKKAEVLKAQSTKDSSVAVLTLKDPIFGLSQGVAAKCKDGHEYGLEYPVTSKIEKGRIEFDLFNFSQSEIEVLPLFALYAAAVSPCPQELMDQSIMGLFFNIKTDSLKLIIRTGNGLFQAGAKLTDTESPPFRFLVEWVADTLTLYINGNRTADVKYSGVPTTGDNRLFVSQSGDRKTTEMRSLRLYLVP